MSRALRRRAACANFPLVRGPGRYTIGLTDSFEVGPAKLSEAASIARLSRMIVEHGLPWRWTPGRVATAIRARDVEVAVIREGDTVAAFAVMEFQLDDAHLVLFGVAPEYQSRGLGRRLLRWLEAMVRNAGLAKVFLEVRADNHTGRAFYRSLGYSELEVRAGYYSGVADAVLMASAMLPIRAR